MKFTILIYYPHTKLTQKVNKQRENPASLPLSELQDCKHYSAKSIDRREQTLYISYDALNIEAPSCLNLMARRDRFLIHHVTESRREIVLHQRKMY